MVEPAVAGVGVPALVVEVPVSTADPGGGYRSASDASGIVGVDGAIAVDGDIGPPEKARQRETRASAIQLVSRMDRLRSNDCFCV